MTISLRPASTRLGSIAASSSRSWSISPSMRATRCPTAARSESRPSREVDARPRASWAWRRGQYAMLIVSDTGTGMAEETRARDVRAVLHDEASGERHRSRARDRLRHRPGGRRPHHDRERARPRHGRRRPLPVVASGSRGRRRRDEIFRHGPTILLVEDEPAVRGLARSSSKTPGTTSSRPAAVARRSPSSSGSATFDLLLTDVVMPEVGGPEVVSRLPPRGGPTRRCLHVGLRRLRLVHARPLRERRLR